MAPVLSWFAARQDANDLRTNIARDIELSKLLEEGSQDRIALARHISGEVAELIDRGESRQRRNRFVKIVRLPYVFLILGMVLSMVGGDFDYSVDNSGYFEFWSIFFVVLSLVWLVGSGAVHIYRSGR